MRNQMLPLHESTLDPDEAWGCFLRTYCSCGKEHSLWDKRCTSCRTRNPFGRLLKKRKRVEHWITRCVEKKLLPAVKRANLLPQDIESYRRILRDFLQRPMPARLPKEERTQYLRRVTEFFPQLFKSTSPARCANEIESKRTRCAHAMAREACQAIESFTGQWLGASVEKVKETVVARQADRVERDLAEFLTPFLESLKILHMVHHRMMEAWVPVRPLLQREPPSGKLRKVWDKLREKNDPVGKLLRFGTALWQTAEEKETMRRLETEMRRFFEQIKRFLSQTEDWKSREAKQLQVYRLSLQKVLMRRLSGRLADANHSDQRKMVERIELQKGVGNWLWRWWVERRHAT
jgi:hypothetical protein